MKMRSRSAYDPLGLRAGRRPASLGASSPLKSLAWTSLRTPNCRLASARARGADCFTLSMSSGAGVQETIMENIFPCCAGLDVHRDSVEACVRRIEPNGRWHQQTRHWGTMTRDLLAMADWMAAQGVTQVAMESTGVYWKPIYNILESRFTVLLVNARHLKQVRGRKSHIRDCLWIAQLLQHGLLKGSFVRPRPQRELRDVTRHRTQLVEEKTRTSNRIEKVLEDANIKLGSVASEVLGVSGRAMIQALLQGEKGPTQIADLAQRQLRGKIPEFEKALEGNLTEHHRFMLRLLWKGLTQQEALIAELEAKIEEVARPFASEIERLDAVPGADRRVAEVVLADVGAKVDPFPTHQQVTAWAATHTKNSYLASQHRRLAGRRGKKRALIAVGHFLLVILYYLLKEGSEY